MRCKRSPLALWLARLAVAIVAVDLVLVFVLGGASFDSLPPLIGWTLWLILSLLGASTWLVVYYRRFFSSWPGWLVPILVLIPSNAVVGGVLPVEHPGLSLLISLLAVVALWAIGVSTAVLLYRRDVGLGLIGWGMAVMVWVLVFAWRFQGNLIELALLPLADPGAASPLWWFNPLMCTFCWIVPLGILGFLGHTVRLIVREWR